MTRAAEIQQQVDKVVKELRTLLLLAAASIAVGDDAQQREEPPQPPQHNESGYMTIREVCEHYQVSEPTIYRWIRAGKFPKGESVGPRLRRWKREEILNPPGAGRAHPCALAQ